MISIRAITDYFARQFRDLSAYKKFSRKELREFIDRRVGFEVKYRRKPRHHDLVCIALGIKFSRLLYLLDMGLGKTSISIILFRLLKRMGKSERAIVCVPSLSNVGDWVAEAKQDAPKLHVVGVMGDKEERKEIMESDADILIITYMGLLRFTCKFVDVKAKKGKKKKQRLVVDKKKLMVVMRKYDHLILDEISQVGGADSITFRVLRMMSKNASHVYGLTGTPFGTDVLALWAQFFIVDLGETLGETLGFFREAFFSKKPQFFGGFDYTFKESKKKVLHRILRNRSVRFKESECLDLPPLIDLVKTCAMSDKAWRHYEKVKEAMQEDRENKEIRENNYIKARQITAGYLVIKAPDGTKIEMKLGENPKLDLLLQVLGEIPPDAKVIIFNVYQRTGQLIEEALKREKIRCLRLYSKTPQKQSVGRRFNEDPKIRALICSEAGAFGLNLQSATYNIFFEQSHDPKKHKQMMKRSHRGGQTKRVFNIYLMVKGSVDVKVYKSVQAGENLFQAIVNGKTSL